MMQTVRIPRCPFVRSDSPCPVCRPPRAGQVPTRAEPALTGGSQEAR